MLTKDLGLKIEFFSPNSTHHEAPFKMFRHRSAHHQVPPGLQAFLQVQAGTYAKIRKGHHGQISKQSLEHQLAIGFKFIVYACQPRIHKTQGCLIVVHFNLK